MCCSVHGLIPANIYSFEQTPLQSCQPPKCTHTQSRACVCVRACECDVCYSDIRFSIQSVSNTAHHYTGIIPSCQIRFSPFPLTHCFVSTQIKSLKGCFTLRSLNTCSNNPHISKTMLQRTLILCKSFL